MNRPPSVAILEGEVLSEAVLDAREMCYMNFARIEHAKLSKILLQSVIPAMGGYDNQMASDMGRRASAFLIKSISLWRVRSWHSAYGAACWLGERPGDERQQKARATKCDLTVLWRETDQNVSLRPCRLSR